MNDELILCTPELERLKIYLATVAAGRAFRPEAREAKEEFALEAESTWMLRGKWTHDAERV